MRLAVATLLLLATLSPLASAATPIVPTCSNETILGLFGQPVCEGEQNGCRSTLVAFSTAGSRCADGTCITDGLNLVNWCHFDGHGTFFYNRFFVWTEYNGPCTMQVIDPTTNDATELGCPAGGPPSPGLLPVPWGDLLP